MKRICVLILLLLWVWSVMGSSPAPGDSIGLKNIDGKALIVYKMSSGETAYAVSRKFSIPFKDLAAVNPGVDMGALKVGQEIFVPAKNNISSAITTPVVPEKKIESPPAANNEVVKTDAVKEPAIKNEAPATEIKAEKTTPVSAENNTVQTAQVQQAVVVNDQSVLASTDLSSSAVTPADKTKSFAQLYAEYLSGAMKPVSEKGVATWIESNGIESSGDRFYALHSTAPIGSIVKVRNMMNNRVIYAKVIGNLSASEQQEKVLIKLSAGAGERLNVIDERFVVEITYYQAEDSAGK